MSTLQNFTHAADDVTDSETTEISYYVIEIVFAVFAIFGNLTVITIYLLEPRLRNTLSNIYLISLAVSDFCMGAIAIPIILIALQGIPRSFPACLFLLSILVMIDVASVFSLLAMTLDRYYSISRPLRYCVVVTKSRAVAGALLAWFVAFLFIVPMLAGWHNGPPSQPQCYFLEVVSLQYMTFLFFAAILAPFFLMCFAYIQIYLIIRKQLKQMRAVHDIGNRLRSTQLSSNPDREGRIQRTQQPSTNDVTRENQTGHCAFIPSGNGMSASAESDEAGGRGFEKGPSH
ncbi:adenosine receptor A2a-like [Asterias amurensis]|uniref:adenosine receptor A2a-like n=1 Tax=Asterias amurensis TaxID=7602 RepID=UPI003AB383C5